MVLLPFPSRLKGCANCDEPNDWLPLNWSPPPRSQHVKQHIEFQERLSSNVVIHPWNAKSRWLWKDTTRILSLSFKRVKHLSFLNFCTWIDGEHPGDIEDHEDQSNIPETLKIICFLTWKPHHFIKYCKPKQQWRNVGCSGSRTCMHPKCSMSRDKRRKSPVAQANNKV